MNTVPATKAKKMNGNGSSRFWDYAVRVAAAATLLLAGGLINQHVTIAKHDLRIDTIESNRFTAMDGVKQQEAMKDWVESRFPPEWLRSSHEELKAMVRANGKKIDLHFLEHRKQ